jgi:cohesin complex subunit SCC1
LPANQSHTAAAGALTLPDTLTELDLLAPLPDPDLLLREPTSGLGMDTTMLDFDTTQMLPESQTPAQKAPRTTLQFDDDDDLGLDLGMDPEPSIEIGRRAATPANDEFTMMDDNAGIPGFEDTTIRESSVAKPFPEDNDEIILPMDDDYPVADVEDIRADNAAALARVDAAREQRSESPLSDAGSEVERELEDAFRLDMTAMEEEDPTMIQAQQQRVKRRRVIGPDAETEIENSQIKRQQEDRSAITRTPLSLPRDPLLLQLMEMQRNGGFVSNIMGDGRMQGWAPELRGVLSIEVIRRAGDKRKRDSGIADVETASERQETPRLDLPEDDEGFQAGPGAGDFGGETTLLSDAPGAPFSEGLQAPADDPTLAQDDDQEDFAASPGQNFDITEAPLLHPSQSGPVSLGTKTAVHLLRQHFAPDYPVSATEPPSPSQRTKTEALFTDLCPEATTSKQDATKLFFEMLVLGTKDAIKVDQSSEELGGPIRVRGKRGLWGDWAEMGESQAAAAVVEGEGEGEVVAV